MTIGWLIKPITMSLVPGLGLRDFNSQGLDKKNLGSLPCHGSAEV